MSSKLNKLSLVTTGLAVATSLIGCGGPEKEDNPQPVDSATLRQAITANTKDLAADISTTIKFLDASSLFQQGADFATPSVSVSCAAPIDGSEPVDCIDEPGPSEELDLDLNDETDQLTQELDRRLLADANIEAASEFAITYLVRGDVFCADDEAPIDPDCVSQVDATQLRLVVTSPSSGNYDVDVLIGPNRANPLSFQSHQDLLAVEADLGGIADSLDHIATVVGEPIELPATFEGRVRAELSAPSSTEVSASLSVLQAVKIANGDFSLAVGTSLPLAQVTANSANSTLTGTSKSGVIDGLFPLSTFTYDSATDTETETSYDLGFHFPGTDAQLTFDAASEIVKLLGKPLDGGPVTMTIDGDQVLSLDLNADVDGQLELTVSEDASGMKVEAAPMFDLDVAMQFAAAAAVLGDVEEWMLDEVLSIELLPAGNTSPAVSFGDEQLEVLDGTLTMSMQNAGVTHTVSAGQCLLGPVGEEPTPAPVDPETDPVDPETDPVAPVEESSNPLEDLAVGACQ